ncbi:hypothetical protein V1508DRAFT_408894 [Lipomyces doorenjongii]|uniref:uncharacterized protein n=1 Tax=Lipomyces doorenjongii TaxID=383834 RepID=UPI0034CE7F15
MQRTVSETLRQTTSPSSLTVPEIESNITPKRHIRLDEAQGDECPEYNDNLDPKPGRSRWSMRHRWSQSPSPSKAREGSSVGRFPVPDHRKSADVTGLETGVGHVTFSDDRTRSTKSTASLQDDKKLSSSNAYRYLFKKHFNPDEPETDDERRVREKIHEVLEFIRKQRIGMMTSQNAKGHLLASATVVSEMENGVDFVFHANTRTLKIEDIDDKPNINLSFQNNETAEWVSIAGTAKISTDIDEIDRYLRNNLNDWGGSDPEIRHKNIGIVNLTTRSIAYSISDNFKFIPMSTTQGGIIRGEIQSSGGTVKIDEPQVKQFRRRYKHSRQRTPSRSRTE